MPVGFAAEPAFWQQGFPQIRLFPVDGDEVIIPLLAVVKDLAEVSFSPDGRALYGRRPQFPSIGRSPFIKIEFRPLRESVVAGSEVFGPVWHMTMSPSSGKIFVAGLTLNEARNEARQCGYFELETGARTIRTIRVPPDGCRKGLGPMSPDGKRAVGVNGAKAGLLDLETGAFQSVKGLVDAVSCNWSPDGARFACDQDGRIVVVDLETLRLRRIGGSGNSAPQWSPDGKSLLVLRSQLSCLPTLYGESLAVVDVETGKRKWVKSAHCSVSGGFWGWVDRDAVQ